MNTEFSFSGIPGKVIGDAGMQIYLGAFHLFPSSMYTELGLVAFMWRPYF